MPQRSDTVFRTQLADRLAAQSLTPNKTPIQSPAEGLANMGSMLAQAWGAKNIRAGVDEDNQKRTAALAKALAGGDPAKEAQISQTIGGDPDLINTAAALQFNNMLNPKEQYEPITDVQGNIIAQRSTKTGQVVVDPRAPKQRESKLFTPEELKQQLQLKVAGREDSGAGGPFAGKAMDAQTYNILLTGDPGSPVYRAAYIHVAQPRVAMDPTTGMISTISPDMSAFRKPGGAPDAPSAPQTTGPVPTITPPPMPGAAVAADNAIKVPGATITQTPGATAKGTPEQVKLRESQATSAAIVDSLNQFEMTFKVAGVGERAASVAGINTGLNTAYNKAALLAKSEDLFNLGVLNGPDLEIIRRTLPDPSTIAGQVGGDAAAAKAVKQVKDLIMVRLNAKERGQRLPLSTEAELLKGLPTAGTTGAPGSVPPPPPGFQIMGQ